MYDTSENNNTQSNVALGTLISYVPSFGAS